MTTYYKVLKEDRSSLYGTGRWTPRRWRSVRGELVPCERGLHLARREDLINWVGPTIWTAEADESEIIVAGDKVVVRRARILTKFDTWNERTARLFAADCAERVLPIYESECPSDPRPRQVIETARRYAEGKAAKKELGAAYEAAYLAALSAAHSAAYSGVHWVAYSAYRAADWADWAADWAARSAYSAAKAVEAASGDPTAERAWQTERLFSCLEGGE